MVGHRWVKRLFIDRQFKIDPDNPEASENPNDYYFIPATVEDNVHMLNSEGGENYRRMLANMPEDLRRAYRYGDWTAIGGNYFPEFSLATHTVKGFKIPDHWPRYVAFDYGLDKFACYWAAVDEDGRSWIYREFSEKGLIVREAAEQIINHTLPNERITATYAPPDMWNRQKDTGKTMAEIFMTNGINIVKSNNNRVQGHMMMKDMMSKVALKDPAVRAYYGDKAPKELPALMFFECCKGVIGDLQDIQADEKNPNDCATTPHEITHSVDGVRYYCIMRTMPAERYVAQSEYDDFEEEGVMDYSSYMCGGEVDASYFSYSSGGYL